MGATRHTAQCTQSKDRLTHRLDRRQLLGMVALGGAMAVSGRGQAASNNRTPKPLRYLAFVDGSRSGTQNIEFVPREQGFTVMSSLNIRVGLAFVTLYRFQQCGEEDWKDGKLIAFEYITNDDGNTSHVTAKRDDSGNFLVTGPTGQRTVPGDSISANFWNSDILNHPHIIDPYTGELATLSTQSLSQKSTRIARRNIQGNGYSFESFVSGALWFDEHRRSLALTFEKKGHRIELVREA
jgi:Family of unknown function (DUF6134)